MKICINNSIIDTKDIFSIGDIIDEWDVHICDILCFNIEFYNDKCRYISIKTNLPYVGYDHEEVFKKVGVENWDEYTIWCRKQSSYIEALERFTKKRQELINLWSDNQSTIPKIEFK